MEVSEGFGKDYAIVLNGDILRMKSLIADLSKVFITHEHEALKGARTLVLLHAPLPTLVAHARTLRMPFMVDEHRLRDVVETSMMPLSEVDSSGALGTKIEPFNIVENSSLTDLSPYSHMYAVMNASTAGILRHADGLAHPFGAAERIQLMHSLIRTECGVNLDRHPEVEAHFPVADEDAGNDLYDTWLSFDVMLRPWLQPLESIKSYFGSRLGFYFLLTGHLALSILLAQALQLVPILRRLLVLHMPVLSSQRELTIDMWFYAVAAPLWGLGTLNIWRKVQHKQALVWGVGGGSGCPSEWAKLIPSVKEMAKYTKFVEPEDHGGQGTIDGGDIHTPQLAAAREERCFVGKEAVWPGDGTTRRVTYPQKYSWLPQLVSFAVLAAVSFAVIVLTVLLNETKELLGSLVVTVVNAVLVSVSLDFGLYICEMLNSRERHQSTGAYEWALFGKFLPLGTLLVLWPLVYIACFKPLTGMPCFAPKDNGTPACIVELSDTVPVYIATFLCTEHFRDVIVPLLSPLFKKCTRWVRANVKELHDHFVISSHRPNIKSADSRSMPFDDEGLAACGGRSADETMESLLDSSSGTPVKGNSRYGSTATTPTRSVMTPAPSNASGRDQVLMKSPLYGPLLSLLEKDQKDELEEKFEEELHEQMSTTERAFNKPSHDPIIFAMRTALRSALHFTFVIVFSGIYPLCPILCYGSLLAGIWTEANMLLFRTRRAAPLAAEGATLHTSALLLCWWLSVVLLVSIACSVEVCYAAQEVNYMTRFADSSSLSSEGADVILDNPAAAANIDGNMMASGEAATAYDVDEGELLKHISARHPIMKALLVQYAMFALGVLILSRDEVPTEVVIQRERQAVMNKKLGLDQDGEPLPPSAMEAYGNPSGKKVLHIREPSLEASFIEA